MRCRRNPPSVGTSFSGSASSPATPGLARVGCVARTVFAFPLLAPDRPGIPQAGTPALRLFLRGEAHALVPPQVVFRCGGDGSVRGGGTRPGKGRNQSRRSGSRDSSAGRQVLPFVSQRQESSGWA